MTRLLALFWVTSFRRRPASVERQVCKGLDGSYCRGSSPVQCDNATSVRIAYTTRQFRQEKGTPISPSEHHCRPSLLSLGQLRVALARAYLSLLITPVFESLATVEVRNIVLSTDSAVVCHSLLE
jgi:hypothetical protein